MHPELTYSPEHYKERLSAYAKDTVDFESFSGLFRYKINKQGNREVVEELDHYFKIYISEGPLSPVNDDDSDEIFFAKIFISIDTTEIEIHLGKWNKIFFFIMVTFLASLACYNIINENFLMVAFLIFLIAGTFSIKKKQEKRYKTLIITFMNTIAAS